jgi:hypothetical protein
MTRKSTQSFILALPLRTTAADERVLAIRLDAARHVYNACLGEALRSPECGNPRRGRALMALNTFARVLRRRSEQWKPRNS